MNTSVIYKVYGCSGEWDDYREWDVTFKVTSEDAEAIRELCQAEADRYHFWCWDGNVDESRDFDENEQRRRVYYERRSSEEADERRLKMFDPWYTDDCDGVTYKVMAIYEDPREDPRFEEQQRFRAEWQAKEKERLNAIATVNDTTKLRVSMGEQYALARASMAEALRHKQCLDCDPQILLHREGETHCDCGEEWPCPEICHECGGTKTSINQHFSCLDAAQARDST